MNGQGHSRSQGDGDDVVLARSAQVDADMEYARAIQRKLMKSSNSKRQQRGKKGQLSTPSSGVATKTQAYQKVMKRHIAADLDDGSSFAATNRSLLFIPCEINELPVEMMVDTGAQNSVISAPLMRKLGLTSKLNQTKQGIAAGVGKAHIIGRVENCPMTIHPFVEFNLFFSCLELEEDVLILGLDQMKRFKCVIDLESTPSKIVFGGKGGVAVELLK